MKMSTESSEPGGTEKMKDETTTVRRRLADRRKGETDWSLVDALTDQEIEATVADDPDAAPLLDEEFWENAELLSGGSRLRSR
jgi:hypothetical protein